MKRAILGVGIALAIPGGFAHAADSTPSGYAQTGAPLVAIATGQPPAPAAPGPSLKASIAAAHAAIKACAERDQKVGVTIVDSAGIPKAVLAADGASARGVQSSTNKALTALLFKAPTSELGERSQKDAELDQALKANPAFNVRAGGLPLRQGESLVGAVGVGGAKVSENDEACAKVAIAALERAAGRH